MKSAWCRRQCRAQDAACGVWHAGSVERRMQSKGFRVRGAECRVQGAGRRVWSTVSHVP